MSTNKKLLKNALLTITSLQPKNASDYVFKSKKKRQFETFHIKYQSPVSVSSTLADDSVFSKTEYIN